MSTIKVTRDRELPRRATKTTNVITTTTPDGASWHLKFDYEDRNKTRVPVGFHIVASPKHSHAVVTTRGMREIPFAALFEEWLRQSLDEPSQPVDPKHQGSKRGEALSPQLLAEVADLYRSALNQGLSPIAFIAEQMGISKSTANKRVIRARRESLLGSTTPGKRGEGIPRVMGSVFKPNTRPFSNSGRPNGSAPQFTRSQKKQAPKKRGERE